MKLSRLPRYNKFRVFLAIPLALVAYVVYTIYLPFGGTITHQISLGLQEHTDRLDLRGPMERLSPPRTANAITYRNVIDDAVYFSLSDLRVRGAEEVSVEIRFKDHFPVNGNLQVGATTTKGSPHELKPVFSTFYESFADLPIVAEDSGVLALSTRVMTTSRNRPLDLEQSAVFFSRPPKFTRIAAQEPGLLDSTITLDEWGPMGPGGFPEIPDVIDQLVATGEANYPFSLRGSHSALVWIEAGPARLDVWKQDLNYRVNPDPLTVSVSSMDGSQSWSMEVPDDGVTSGTKKLGSIQRQTLEFDVRTPGWHRVELQPLNPGEVLLRGVSVNGRSVLIADSVFLAGPAYHPSSSSSSNVYFYAPSPTVISAKTLHSDSLQVVRVSGSGVSHELVLREAGRASTAVLQEGVYEIRSEMGNVLLNGDGFFFFAPGALERPVAERQALRHGYETQLDAPLLGPHTAWVYVTRGPLSLAVAKQDLNQANGPDRLEITISDVAGLTVGTASVPDDGITADAGSLGPVQTTRISIDVGVGAYKIALQANDDTVIHSVSTDQPYLVLASPVTLAASSALASPGLNTLQLYFKTISSSTAFRASAPTFVLSGPDGTERTPLGVAGESLETQLGPGAYVVSSSRGGITLKADTYFATNPNAYFPPLRYIRVPWRNSAEYLVKEADYIVLETDGYIQPTTDGSWLVGRATWSAGDIVSTDGEVGFVLRVPHLKWEGYGEWSVPVDWIRVSYRVLPFWERW